MVTMRRYDEKVELVVNICPIFADHAIVVLEVTCILVVLAYPCRVCHCVH